MFYMCLMRCIARITFQYHEFEPPKERAKPEYSQWVLHLYRVVGNSPSFADRLCIQGADEHAIQQAIAITIEDLKPLGRAHIAVCSVAKRGCAAMNRNFHLCGVTAENRKLLADSGLLDGISAQNIHSSIAALLPSLCNNPAPRQPRSESLTIPQAIGSRKDIFGCRHNRIELSQTR